MNGQSVNDDIKDGAALLGRMLMATLFVVSGFGKIPGFEGTVGYISHAGLPFPQLLAALAILFELGGGIAIAIGWKTRLAALALALFMVVITPIFHRFWGLPPEVAMQQQIHFMKNVAVLGGILVLYAFGPGRYSLDKA
ncbi:MAG TPA: DoxX family protein [Casimicrobiaceae bacterium]|nr:DoxX family protein [Casimicrobiaceae bacterium]